VVQNGKGKTVASVARKAVLGCDGFRIESSHGLLGWAEETWLEPSGAPSALAVRTVDGRRGLLLTDEIEAVVPESELVYVASAGRLLELDVPRVQPTGADGSFPSHIAASWQTTGELLEPPSPPGLLQRAMLELRPWRLAPPAASGAERPIWQTVGILYAAIAFLVILLIGISFLAAHLATGRAY
jgi:hypothetical protein